MNAAGRRMRTARAVALAAALLGAVSLAAPAAAAQAAAPRVTTARAPRAAPARTTTAQDPYGNPYTSYLRQPYGVLPQADASTPPVRDNPNEPFGWYRSPWAALGVFGGAQETMITPQGFLQTDFGTLQFDTGSSLTPINQRIKTWKDGWLPIAEYTYASGGASYHVEAFDTTVPGVTKIPVSQAYGVGSRRRTASADVDNMVTFARVTVTNTTSSAGTFTLGIGLTGQPAYNPVHRGAPLPADLAYDPARRALIGTGSGGRQEAALAVSTPPTTNVGGADHTLAYRMTLAPHASRSVTVMLPYWIAQASDLGPIEHTSYGAERAATQRFWTRELAKSGGDVGIPEAKVTDTYKASIVALLINALTIVGNYWSTVGNPTIYDGFYIRDAAFHIEALLDAGFSGVVRHILASYPAWQDPATGRYVGAQASEYDSNGEALWAIGQYMAFTHDTAFAKTILPSVKAAMTWQWNYRKANWANSGGLYPVNQIGDDEQVKGHITGFDLWAISGAEGAVTVARQAGDTADAALWSRRAAQFARILKQKLTPAFRQIHAVPPATEGIKGQGLEDGWYGNVYGIDWGNLGLVWPSGVFSPHGPMVTSSLKVWQQKMFEGIFTYPAGGNESLLHSYAPLSIPETYTRAGDQWAAVRYLYDTLVHTSAMGMASEGMNAAGRWGWGPSTVTMPHNQFSAEYAALVHDMLAYAGEDGSLHLASVYSPAWTRPGDHITFSGPTVFGPASYTITMTRDGMVMRLTPPTRNAPRSIIVHAPQNTSVTSVTGAPGAKASGNEITLPPLAHPVTLRIRWRVAGAAPAYSFGRAVQDYLANYHKMTSPPDVRVEDTAAGHRTVRAGYSVQVTATVVNTGGAGYLASPDVTLYVDGKPVQTDDRTFARGIGFTTPKSIISFNHHTEGVVPVGFATTFCQPGKHTLDIALGDHKPTQTVTVNVLPMVPSQPAPVAHLTLHAGPAFVGGGAGEGTTATATITNHGCAAITGVNTSLHAPDGWTAQPTSPTTIDRIGPGDSATVTWRATPPSGQAPTPGAKLTATAHYGWQTARGVEGDTTGSAQGSTTVAVCAGTRPPAEPGVRAQWDFTRGCGAADLSGHGHMGTSSPGVTFTDSGATFDGTDQGVITIPYGAAYQPETVSAGQTWTLDLTGVVPEKVGADYQAIANARSELSSGFDVGWTVYITPGGDFQFWMSETPSTAYYAYAVASAGVQAVPGKRYDITATWNGTRLTIAVSGGGNGSGSANIQGSYVPVGGNAPLTFGHGGIAGDNYFFTGKIATAKITIG